MFACVSECTKTISIVINKKFFWFKSLAVLVNLQVRLQGVIWADDLPWIKVISSAFVSNGFPMHAACRVLPICSWYNWVMRQSVRVESGHRNYPQGYCEQFENVGKVAATSVDLFTLNCFTKIFSIGYDKLQLVIIRLQKYVHKIRHRSRVSNETW